LDGARQSRRKLAGTDVVALSPVQTSFQQRATRAAPSYAFSHIPEP